MAKQKTTLLAVSRAGQATTGHLVHAFGEQYRPKNEDPRPDARTLGRGWNMTERVPELGGA